MYVRMQYWRQAVHGWMLMYLSYLRNFLQSGLMHLSQYWKIELLMSWGFELMGLVASTCVKPEGLMCLHAYYSFCFLSCTICLLCLPSWGQQPGCFILGSHDFHQAWKAHNADMHAATMHTWSFIEIQVLQIFVGCLSCPVTIAMPC